MSYGQGHVINEELFAIETISSRTQFLMDKPSERPNPVMHPVMDKKNISAAARQLGIHIRAAQRWVKRYYEGPESIFEKKNKNSEERYDWVQKWQQTDLDFTTNCVFLDESAFHINLKRGMAWSKKSAPAIATVPTTKANASSILGGISANGLINVSL
ncbi:uncharacterized protein BX663DRAFT_563725 [Cokeromyces recurvatus]|uniref:uncharacterized protein n=1 Tax=Cokeromyces recurvatus TaxID=90255 RepID=UPI00221F40FB|nr:uncharacterized protein BX663DRAFT_563725 [Cokeromyces recurvatus]KAI7899554.1 hypothetical protein BX663DRAFT_563725 [Cokeromyces recurvatus]